MPSVCQAHPLFLVYGVYHRISLSWERLLINNIKPHFIRHSTDSFNCFKRGWKSTFMGGGCSTRFGIFALFALTMRICPSFQRGDEELRVFISRKIQTQGLHSTASLWAFLTLDVPDTPRAPWARQSARMVSVSTTANSSS